MKKETHFPQHSPSLCSPNSFHVLPPNPHPTHALTPSTQSQAPVLSLQGLRAFIEASLCSRPCTCSFHTSAHSVFTASLPGRCCAPLHSQLRELEQRAEDTPQARLQALCFSAPSPGQGGARALHTPTPPHAPHTAVRLSPSQHPTLPHVCMATLCARP